MRRISFRLLVAVISVLLLSCNSSNKTATEEQGGIQIDPELKELGELNALLFQYDDAGPKLGDCIAVKSKKKWGLINHNGDTIIDFKYDAIERIPDTEYWSIKIKNTENSHYSNHYDVGIADSNGKILIKPIKGKENCKVIGDGLYVVDNGSVQVLIDDKGEEIVIGDEDGYDFPLKAITRVADNIYMVSNMDDLWFRMTYKKDADPQFLIDSVAYYEVLPTKDYCFVKNEGGKWGAIDKQGNLITSYIYNGAKQLGNENVFVQNEEGKWGVFNGKSVDAYYDDFYRAIDDYSIAQSGEEYVVIDKQGKELFRNKDLQVHPFYSHGVFLGRHSVYDPKGNKIVSLNDSLNVVDYVNGYVVVGSESGNYGVVNKEGTIVVPIINYMNPTSQKGSSLILLTKNISDVVVDGERIIVNVTDIFNTEKGTLTKTIFDLSSCDYSDGLSLAEIEGRHVYINEEGKSGIVNLEDVLKSLAEQKEKAKQQEQEKEQQNSIEHIKEQLVESINRANSREILSGTYSIHDFVKCEDGTYKAEFYDHGVYETITYEIYNIKTDGEGNLSAYDLKMIMIRPTSKKPEGGIKTVEEIVKHQIGAVGY